METGDIERNISHMQNDMIKLNVLLHKEKGMETNLQQNNILMENDFIGSLKVTCFEISDNEKIHIVLTSALPMGFPPWLSRIYKLIVIL